MTSPSWVPDPVVATLSLGATRRLTLVPRRPRDGERQSLELPAGSLLVHARRLPAPLPPRHPTRAARDRRAREPDLPARRALSVAPVNFLELPVRALTAQVPSLACRGAVYARTTRRDVRLHARRGTCLGKYQVVRLIGEGGMGAVYEAVHLGIGKKVAIKIMSADLAGTRRARPVLTRGPADVARAAPARGRRDGRRQRRRTDVPGDGASRRRNPRASSNGAGGCRSSRPRTSCCPSRPPWRRRTTKGSSTAI